MNNLKHYPRRYNQSAAATGINRTRTHGDTDTWRLIEFASMWAPYGGASAEDILVRFGMTPSRFIDRLWEIIPQYNFSPEQLRHLTKAYPRHRTK
jgi:hypothetical protein